MRLGIENDVFFVWQEVQDFELSLHEDKSLAMAFDNIKRAIERRSHGLDQFAPDVIVVASPEMFSIMCEHVTSFRIQVERNDQDG